MPLAQASHKKHEIFSLVFECFLSDLFWCTYTSLSQNKNYVDFSDLSTNVAFIHIFVGKGGE